MTQDLNVALVMSLKDKLVGPLKQAVDATEREFKDLERELARTASTSAKAADGLARIAQAARGTRGAAGDLKRLGDEAAAAERQVSRLAQAGARLRGFASGVGSAVAGATAFSMVAADPLRRAADYDTQLRQLANTAYAGKPLAERRAGLGSLNAAITNAVRGNGGTREQALEALSSLIANSFGDVHESASMLPLLMRGATASGADPKELAMIVLRAKQSMGVSDVAGMADVLDRAIVAGQAGGFELKDMAKWLPQQMAAAKLTGMSGIKGISQLLAANQAVAITAGTTDGAGNNLLDLLTRINAESTAKDFQRLGINLPGRLAAANAKGMDSLSAFVGIVDKVVAADPRYRKARAAADAAGSDDERRSALMSQVDLLQGTAIGKMIQDRQSLMALVGLMNNRGYMADVHGKLDSAKGAINDAAGLMTEGAGFIYDQRNFEVQKAQTDAMTSANSAVTQLAQAQIDLYQRYPGFAEALEGGKVAVQAFTAALAAAGVANLLTGGAGALGGAGGAAGAAGSLARVAGAAGGVALAGAAGWGVGSWINDKIAGTQAGDMVGTAMAYLASPFSSEASEAIASMNAYNKQIADETAAMNAKLDRLADRPIQLQLDGAPVFEWYSRKADAQARRQ